MHILHPLFPMCPLMTKYFATKIIAIGLLMTTYFAKKIITIGPLITKYFSTKIIAIGLLLTKYFAMKIIAIGILITKYFAMKIIAIGLSYELGVFPMGYLPVPSLAPNCGHHLAPLCRFVLRYIWSLAELKNEKNIHKETAISGCYVLHEPK